MSNVVIQRQARQWAVMGSSLPTEVYTHIQDAICSGLVAPGQRLIDTELAVQLGVSRTPIREALRALTNEKLVDAVHGSGFAVRRFSLQEIEDAYEIRAVLEGLAARKTAQHADAETMWQLNQAVDYSERFSADGEDFQVETRRALSKANLRFHELIADASGNRTLIQVVRQLSIRPHVYRAMAWYGPEERQESDRVHRDIVDAIASGEGGRAEALMVEHTNQIRDFLLSALKQHPELLAEGQ